MRTLTVLTGTCFFLLGMSVFIQGPAWDLGFMAAGTIFGMLGLLILGLSSEADSAGSARNEPFRAKTRLRPRSSTGMRSLRMRRSQAGVGGGR